MPQLDERKLRQLAAISQIYGTLARPQQDQQELQQRSQNADVAAMLHILGLQQQQQSEAAQRAFQQQQLQQQQQQLQQTGDLSQQQIDEMRRAHNLESGKNDAQLTIERDRLAAQKASEANRQGEFYNVTAPAEWARVEAQKQGVEAEKDRTIAAERANKATEKLRLISEIVNDPNVPPAKKQQYYDAFTKEYPDFEQNLGMIKERAAYQDVHVAEQAVKQLYGSKKFDPRTLETVKAKYSDAFPLLNWTELNKPENFAIPSTTKAGTSEYPGAKVEETFNRMQQFSNQHVIQPGLKSVYDFIPAAANMTSSGIEALLGAIGMPTKIARVPSWYDKWAQITGNQ